MLRWPPIPTTHTSPSSRLIGPFPHIPIPQTLRLALGALSRLPRLSPVIRIGTGIMPPHAALCAIASYTVRDELPAAFAVMNAYAFDALVALVGCLVVGFLEVGTEFHERARREGKVAEARLVEESVVDERGEDGVGFGDGNAGVCCLRAVAVAGAGMRSVIAVVVVGHARAVELRGPGSPRGTRELRCFGVLERHDFARWRVVGFEHGVDQPAYVGNLTGRKLGRELGERVGGVVDEGVHRRLGALIARVSYFEIKRLDFRIDGLDCVGDLGLGYVPF